MNTCCCSLAGTQACWHCPNRQQFMPICSGRYGQFSTGDKGWQCPRCHKIYSPDVLSCGCCVATKNPKTEAKDEQR